MIRPGDIVVLKRTDSSIQYGRVVSIKDDSVLFSPRPLDSDLLGLSQEPFWVPQTDLSKPRLLPSGGAL